MLLEQLGQHAVLPRDLLLERSDPRLELLLGASAAGRRRQHHMRLRRELDEKLGGQVRTGASEPVPAGYADAVAEYFRRLSQQPAPR